MKDSNGNVLSCTSINFKYGENWNSTPILINSDNEISVDLSVVANNGNGSSSSSNYPLTIYNGSSNTDYITYDGSSAAYLRFKSGFSISKVGLGYEISVSGGGSGSSGTTDYSLTFYKDGSAESWNGEKNFRIIFGNGLNVDWDTNHTYLTLSTVGGSSTGGSVDLSSYLTKTEASATYAAKSHTHSASSITGFEDAVKVVKVNNAVKADKANELNSAVTLWGNYFYGSNNINGNIKMGSEGGGSIQLWMNNGNMLDRTNNILHIGNGLKGLSDGEIYLDAYATKVYTDNMSKHYDFKSNVFDVNSNQIHFGSETNGGKISWDAANNAFKIEGNVYATGGITALGVSNNSTTSNNVDFTFRSVTINSTNQNKVQLTGDGLEFYNQDNINAYYKKDSIGLYDSANDASSTIFRFFDGELTFGPNVDSFNIKFNYGLSCYTDENTLNVGTNEIYGFIYFYPGSTMTFKHNNKEYDFNVAKAIEQGILTR